MDLTRRSLAVSLLASPLAMAGCTLSPYAPTVIGPERAAAGGLLPREPLHTLIRIRGDLNRPAWLWFEGNVYGRAPDGVITPVFGFTSVLIVRYEMLGPERAAFEQRESAHYTDLGTGQPIGEFHNPFTGRTNIAIGYVSPRFRYELTADGAYSARTGKRVGDKMAGLEGDAVHVWTTERRAFEFPAGITREDFPNAFRDEIRRSADVATYRARRADLDTPPDAFVPATLDVVADTPWPLWMFMADQPGHAIWIGHGGKYAGVDGIPSKVRARIDSVHPGFLDTPWTLDGTPYSTAGQMRALRAAGKI